MCRQRRTTFKTILNLLCHSLWVLGIAVGLSGVYLVLKWKQNSLFFSDTYITLPAALTLVSAAFLLATGCLGSWLSQRDSVCLQGLFVYLLVVVFCLESTASVLAYYHSTKLDAEMAPLTGVFQNYTGSSQDHNSRIVDSMQEEFQCCGVHDYRDWLKMSWFNQTGGIMVPRSCCNTTFTSCNGTVQQPWKLYSQGCQVKLERVLNLGLSFIIWGFIPVFVMEVVLVLMVAELMKQQPFADYHVLGEK
ncbi:tetraspanin 37 [Parambassis ranga]|uniref:Tetraspanin n=1 Tax=Parambassis ranga TaxID=210632 RepID=A0A6P7HK13_9TELE|nr:tetraspanin-3-like [Parambassis ranga]XP_028252251.1 tetraspanin-3-like [Parambassis ranga]